VLTGRHKSGDLTPEDFGNSHPKRLEPSSINMGGASKRAGQTTVSSGQAAKVRIGESTKETTSLVCLQFEQEGGQRKRLQTLSAISGRESTGPIPATPLASLVQEK